MCHWWSFDWISSSCRDVDGSFGLKDIRAGRQRDLGRQQISSAGQQILVSSGEVIELFEPSEVACGYGDPNCAPAFRRFRDPELKVPVE
jgi:hypothetical protein